MVVISRRAFIQNASQLVWEAAETFLIPCLWLGVVLRCHNGLILGWCQMWTVSRNWSAVFHFVVDVRIQLSPELHFCFHLSPVADSRVLAGSGASA